MPPDKPIDKPIIPKPNPVPVPQPDPVPVPVPRPDPVPVPRPNPPGPKKLKLVLVGDTSVGKSALITNYLYNLFNDEYEPTVLNVYKGVKNVGGKKVDIEIHDTSGDDHLGVNRKVQYQDADCFMICVACNVRESYENIAKWKAEIMEVES